MNRALFLLVLALPTAARAGHHCREVSPIVGYQQCGWFGSWSFGEMAAWELGVSALRFDGAEAVGGRSRLSFGFGRTFYVASQLDFGAITREPAANVTERATMPSAAGGRIVQGEMLLGAHRRYGQLTIAAEAGPGMRVASFARPTPMQAWFVLDVHPKLDLWLAPNISLGVIGGFDVVQHDGFSAALVLGFHVTPYDMAR